MQVHILRKHPQNCQNTSTYFHPHITKKLKQPQYKIHTKWNSQNTIKCPQYKVILINSHTVKTCGALNMLYLDTRWSWVVSFTTRQLCSQSAGCCGRETNSMPVLINAHSPPDPPVAVSLGWSLYWPICAGLSCWNKPVNRETVKSLQTTSEVRQPERRACILVDAFDVE